MAHAEEEPFPFASSLNDPVPTDTQGREFTELPSGLKYIDLKVGDGRSPTDECAVTIGYTGWLEDGRVFDSSSPGQPSTVAFKGLIPGWQMALETMKEGGKRQVILPPHLAYGSQGRKEVPPNATVMFEFELVKVTPFPKLKPVPSGVEEHRAVFEIKFWDIEVGTGPSPVGNERVVMKYTMYEKDGTILDTSVKKDIPVTVSLDQLFPGWREMMYTMKVGGKRRFEIPPPLAAGREGVKDWIPPNTTLVVDVELLGIEPELP